jgi:FAD-dependent urate hydroxylase
MTSHTRTALVIGGGIAGPIAAMALRQAGIEATVYEARRGPADGIGGGLSIAPNGLNALDVIGAGDVVRSIGTPMTGIVMRSWTGKVLGELDGPPGLAPRQFVWRTDLCRALRAAAAGRGIRTVHGKRLTGARDTGDGVTARFADGTQAGADILVGADGIHSTVRTLIDPAAPRPRYAGLLGFSAPMIDTGLPSTRGAMHICYGKRASFGYQVNDDSSGGWFVNLPRRDPMTTAQAREVGAAEWLRVLGETFAADRTPAPAMLRRTAPADLLITGPLETMPVVPAWSRGRMVLIGDAVHAASPSSGQGASIAIESAVQLARCLRDLAPGEAFAAYERLRRARVERIIAAAARTNGNKASPVARVLRDLLMPVAMRVAVKMVRPEKMAWQFDYRIDWNAAVGAHPGTARG